MAPASDEMVISLPQNEIPDESGARSDARGLAGMIEAQAARTAAATAVRFGDKLATYCELNAAAKMVPSFAPKVRNSLAPGTSQRRITPATDASTMPSRRATAFLVTGMRCG